MSTVGRAVGSTPLIKVKELCGQCHDATVFVKDESKNPFGTFKDRRCAALLEKYKDKEQLVFVHITSGNSGRSLGMMAEEERERTGRVIRVINIVGKGTPELIVDQLKSCSTVVEMDLSAQVGLDVLRTTAIKAAGYPGPASNIVPVEEYHIANGYSNIIKEIKEEGITPKYIFCPVGGGELLVELTDAAKEAWGADAPKIIGVTIKQNVLHRAKEFISNIKKTIADKLATPYSMYKDLVNNRVRDGRAELMAAHPKEHEIATEYESLNRLGIAAEPSAAVAFWGAKHYNLTSDDTVVIINTGKGLFDPSSVQKVFRTKLKNALKVLGIAAAGALLAFGIKLGYDQYKDYKSHQHWNLANEAAIIIENGWGVYNVDKAKLKMACQRIPGMDESKCKGIVSVQDLDERQLRYIIQMNGIDKDNVFMGLRMLYHEWYEKYPTWMPGEGVPETYEMDSMGWPIESTRKPKPEFRSTSDWYKEHPSMP